MANRTDAIMARKGEIMKRALGMDYAQFEQSPIAFDYEAMMASHGYSLDDIVGIQTRGGVGNTPLLELRNLTDLVRSYAEPGFGARIFVKDEAANMAGSFKDRRASVSHPRRRRAGLRRRHRRHVRQLRRGGGEPGGAQQPELHHRARRRSTPATSASPRSSRSRRICEAFGAEVVQLTVGPELFSHMLELLDETGYFAASLYSSFGVSGIETLGLEIANEMRAVTGKDPDAVVITHAGGGNTTGTARGLKRAGATGDADRQRQCRPVRPAHGERHRLQPQELHHRPHRLRRAVRDLARPRRRAAQRRALACATWTATSPSRRARSSTSPRRCASSRASSAGRRGNTAMTAAMSLARTMPTDATIVVQETEYTGAGKHHWAQLNFAREMGVEVRLGDPKENKPGQAIVIPEHPEQIEAVDFDLAHMRKSYVRNALTHAPEGYAPTADDIEFLAADTNSDAATVEATIAALREA